MRFKKKTKIIPFHLYFRAKVHTIWSYFCQNDAGLRVSGAQVYRAVCFYVFFTSIVASCQFNLTWQNFSLVNQQQENNNSGLLCQSKKMEKPFGIIVLLFSYCCLAQIWKTNSHLVHIMPYYWTIFHTFGCGILTDDLAMMGQNFKLHPSGALVVHYFI